MMSNMCEATDLNARMFKGESIKEDAREMNDTDAEGRNKAERLRQQRAEEEEARRNDS
jgi:hypothetical protein